MAKEQNKGEQLLVSMRDVESKIAVIRNREVIADADIGTKVFTEKVLTNLKEGGGHKI